MPELSRDAFLSIELFVHFHDRARADFFRFVDLGLDCSLDLAKSLLVLLVVPIRQRCKMYRQILARELTFLDAFLTAIKNLLHFFDPAEDVILIVNSCVHYEK